MTDKEQIINGVDVSGCSGYCPELGKYNCIALACNSAAICKQSPNCYYKQLQRRIAECEELKKNNQILCDLYKNVDSCLQKRTEKFDHYRKALDEIERICLEDVHIFADGTELRYDSLDDILDIINKLKGGNDE